MQSAFSPGIHLVDKPPGPSSASLVRAFAEEIRAAGIRPDKLPLCHGGALDPFAEGLLLILAGPATRLMESLHAIPKSYEATIDWGTETDSGDALGKVVPTPVAVALAKTPFALTPSSLDAALRDQLGWQDQVPPAHSNKRIGGERAYLKAHRGEEVTLPSSRVYLHQARWLSHHLTADGPRSRLQLSCRGGYYVRALARDLGRALGCGAHLSALRRTSIGPWACPPAGERVLIVGAQVMPWCPSRRLTAREARLVESRQSIPCGDLQAPDWPLPPDFAGATGATPIVRALREGKLLALLARAGDALHPHVLLGQGM